ncbi:MAG TPA: DUF2911 domain-containing protein [Flavobacteriaceae bacterium]|nr:DUF2911 domain-containing protein [Flavobacteriaceae bacterium]
MNEKVKWLLIGLGSLILLAVISFIFLNRWTKSFSPEDTVQFRDNDLKIEVFYNRPYKKDRKIFGGLVPYNQVWRTGANEATTFETNKDISVDGSLLKSGKYTLWTIPKEESWELIFNSKMYGWGINLEGKPSRKPEYDVLKIEVPVLKNYKTIEQFTIYFEDGKNLNYMFLAWENTVVPIAFSVQ